MGNLQSQKAGLPAYETEHVGCAVPGAGSDYLDPQGDASLPRMPLSRGCG